MAKSRSIIQLSGTVDGTTHVDSKTYGSHTRKARGTHKPAIVNDTLKANNERMVTTNDAAKLIKDEIDKYRKEFLAGQFWQNLNSVLRKQYRIHNNFDPACLKGLEVHDDYPLNRFRGHLSRSANIEATQFKYTVYYTQHPKFRSKSINTYRMQVVFLFLDYEKERVQSHTTYAPIQPILESPTPFTETLSIPAGFHYYLIALKLEGCINEHPYMQSHKGMQIIDGGSLKV